MDDKKPSGAFSYKGKTYASTPSTMERLKEGFQTTDDRAQLEAIRRAKQSARDNGLG